jgi:hypothetical protein
MNAPRALCKCPAIAVGCNDAENCKLASLERMCVELLKSRTLKQREK